MCFPLLLLPVCSDLKEEQASSGKSSGLALLGGREPGKLLCLSAKGSLRTCSKGQVYELLLTALMAVKKLQSAKC